MDFCQGGHKIGTMRWKKKNECENFFECYSTQSHIVLHGARIYSLRSSVIVVLVETARLHGSQSCKKQGFHRFLINRSHNNEHNYSKTIQL